MVKKGQIDNGEEFKKLFPERISLHQKDMVLRNEFNILKKSLKYDLIPKDIQIDLNRAMMQIRSCKSGLLRGHVDISVYEKSLVRLEKQLLIVSRFFEGGSKFSDLRKIDKLENDLLQLSNDVLVKLVIRVINKSKIFLSHEDFGEELDIIKYINIHKDLKEKFKQEFQLYTLPERRHIANALTHLGKVKSGSDDNSKRTIINYCDKISKLKDFMTK